MTMFLENPIPILVVGVVAEAILALIFVNTRRGSVLAAMGVVLALMLLGVLTEHLIVTPREEVENMIDDLAAALKSETDAPEAKKQQVLGFLSTSAKDSRRKAEQNLDKFTLTGAWIRHLEVTVNELTNPPSAHVTFTGMLTGKYHAGQLPFNSVPVQFEAKLRKENGRWVIAAFRGVEPRSGYEVLGDWTE